MADQAAPQKLITELKATAHLMLLDVGLFCIFHLPGGQAPDARTGLPGVRLSLPPTARQPGRARISTFHEDGWIGGADGAALVRVEDGPAQILVTVYQATDGAQEAPRLQVMRLTGEQPGEVREQPAASRPAVPSQPASSSKAGSAEILAHVYGRGDVGARLGDWIGERGSKRWVEGFAIAPPGMNAGNIEYQAVLGRDWVSPWAEGGQFCGSRGMSLPILGLRARLRGEVAKTHDLALVATFVDGSETGPVEAGETCQAQSFAPLEAFRVELRPHATASKPTARVTEVQSRAKPASAKAAAVRAKPGTAKLVPIPAPRLQAKPKRR